MNCLECKNHYSQGGNCYENKRNCLFFEQEPRGKMVRTTFKFEINRNAETPIIKPGAKVSFQDKGIDVEMKIVKINWINLSTMLCCVDAEYHENEKPYFEKKKEFRIMKSD